MVHKSTKETAQEALAVATSAQELTVGALAFAEEQRRLVAMHEINQRNLTEQLSTFVHERDELRAEIERLRAALRFAVSRHRASCACQACDVFWGDRRDVPSSTQAIAFAIENDCDADD